MREPFSVKGADWLSLSTRGRARLVREAFNYWRNQGFPYYSLGPAEIHREFKNLAVQKVPSSAHDGFVAGSNVGLRLANNFHPQMWSVRVSRYLSPMDVFMDDNRLARALELAWSLWPERYGARPSSLRRILKSFPGAASVSNFRPAISRAVTASYTEHGETVVDFCAGYGGRMLGCLSVGRYYVGVEPCRAQVRGSLRMFATLRKLGLTEASAVIKQGCAEEVLPDVPSGSAALVFSSPPYYDWERYSSQTTQSYRRHGSYEAWLTGFLAPAISESRRILQRGGHLILNVSGKQRRPDRADVERLATRCGLVLNSTVPMLLARIPYLHPRSGGAYKPELLLIFKKT